MKIDIWNALDYGDCQQQMLEQSKDSRLAFTTTVFLNTYTREKERQTEKEGGGRDKFSRMTVAVKSLFV